MNVDVIIKELENLAKEAHEMQNLRDKNNSEPIHKFSRLVGG